MHQCSWRSHSTRSVRKRRWFVLQRSDSMASTFDAESWAELRASLETPAPRASLKQEPCTPQKAQHTAGEDITAGSDIAFIFDVLAHDIAPHSGSASASESSRPSRQPGIRDPPPQASAGPVVVHERPGHPGPASVVSASPAIGFSSCDSASSDGQISSLANQLCHACDQRRTPGHRWCKRHKGVYDSLVKDIVSKKKIDPELYKREWAAHQLTMKDPILSAQTVLQFEINHPEVVKGRKRGTFDHLSFWETYSKKTFTRDESVGKFMDFVEYSRKMERKRGWTVG